MGYVGERHQERCALEFDLIDLDLNLPDLLRARFVGDEDVRRVLTLPLCAGDLVARGVLLAFQSFEFGNEPPPAGFERRELLEFVVGLKTPVSEAGANVIEVLSHEGGIEHAVNPIPDQSPWSTMPLRMTRGVRP
jgi:hypothetical protein